MGGAQEQRVPQVLVWSAAWRLRNRPWLRWRSEPALYSAARQGRVPGARFSNYEVWLPDITNNTPSAQGAPTCWMSLPMPLRGTGPGGGLRQKNVPRRLTCRSCSHNRHAVPGSVWEPGRRATTVRLPGLRRLAALRDRHACHACTQTRQQQTRTARARVRLRVPGPTCGGILLISATYCFIHWTCGHARLAILLGGTASRSSIEALPQPNHTAAAPHGARCAGEPSSARSPARRTQQCPAAAETMQPPASLPHLVAPQEAPGRLCPACCRAHAPELHRQGQVHALCLVQHARLRSGSAAGRAPSGPGCIRLGSWSVMRSAQATPLHYIARPRAPGPTAVASRAIGLAATVALRLRQRCLPDAVRPPACPRAQPKTQPGCEHAPSQRSTRQGPRWCPPLLGEPSSTVHCRGRGNNHDSS